MNESSNEHIPLISSTYDSFDSDHSSDSNRSMEHPPSMDNRVPPKESLIRNINLFTSLFDSSISELQDQIDKLKEITKSVEKIHRKATVGSLSGGVFGAVGGIMTIVGLALTPVTLGASLIVTGVGAGVAVSGGVAGAASNISNMIHQKVSRDEIENILKIIQDRLSPILENLKEIEIVLDQIQQADPTDPSGRNTHIGFGIGRGAGYTAEQLRLIKVVEVGKIAAQVSRTVQAAGAVTGVLAGLKGLKGMKDTVGQLTKTLDELQGVRNQLNA